MPASHRHALRTTASDTYSLADRIASISQPHMRPMVWGIRLRGKPLGRPKRPTLEYANELRAHAHRILERQDARDLIPVEGKFGNCKRKGSLQRVMAKLAHTSESVIHLGIGVLNLDKWLAELLLRLFCALRERLQWQTRYYQMGGVSAGSMS